MTTLGKEFNDANAIWKLVGCWANVSKSKVITQKIEIFLR
jgi:hypothetical protein